MIPIRSITCRYSHLPIGGGGYVTGFIFHPADSHVLYARTDIGGVYRFDDASQQWISLIDHVSHEDLRETCPISAAVDPTRPQRLYIASGLWDENSRGLLTVSDDRGETFRGHELPCYVHGNLHGRGAGERLIVDPEDTRVLWLASQTDGLWRSPDEGASWRRVAAFPETGCTFVFRHGSLLLAGTEGLACRRGDMRGHSLYASLDGGKTFRPVPQVPCETVEGSRLQGLVAQRCTSDGKFLYVTFSANGPRSQHVERGYTCDSGDSRAGRVVRYRLDGGMPADPVNITPEQGDWGYSAIDVQHGLLITATISRRDGDAVYLSRDGGDTWTTILHRLEKGRMDFRLSYMQPRYNGGRNLIHWLTDVKIDPHRPDTAWFNTGTGVFRTQNLTADPVVWQDWCDGMEETVHIGVYAPPAGRVQVLDMIGDLGGFAFTDIRRHCENSFADARGNRYITCLSCDWQDGDPDHIIVTARGNWTGETKGGLIVSRDGAQSWTRLAMPQGLSPELDTLLTRISGVNVNAGWCAMTADGGSYVWAVADRIRLHARNVIVSHDGGATFRTSRVLDLHGLPAEGLMKPVADRVDPMLLFGFGEAGQLYISTDGGDTFRQQPAPEGFPASNFGLVDCADQTELRAASGQKGVLYAATGEGGLWKLHYHHSSGTLTCRRLTAPGDSVACMGLGLGAPGADYAASPKALYCHGRIGSQYGFFRTLDEGASFERLNTPGQSFGRIHSIDGDKRVYGRFYIATGSTGLICGEEQQ